MMAPQIFTFSVEKLRTNSNYLVELGITREKLPCIIARVPQCLGLTSARVKESITALDKMFGAGAGVRAFTWNCRIVMYNIDSMRESYHYLLSLGFTKERLAKNTRFITRNVDRFLRPRVEFLAEQNHNILDEVSWILKPNVAFIEKYPEYEAYLADYKTKNMSISHA
ncbi:unnamed protein product [Phytophthora fragariaefolia]|uniref:Unnamed protein product n=1 Tax=Phytophthora fragariaefolia TaxID=1490495 RepID=A0A9W6XB25_9STRA|nr:unnamed protein product [Phytophthora fragariaefolia]